MGHCGELRYALWATAADLVITLWAIAADFVMRYGPLRGMKSFSKNLY
jgi:hypothetical protein